MTQSCSNTVFMTCHTKFFLILIKHPILHRSMASICVRQICLILMGTVETIGTGSIRQSRRTGALFVLVIPWQKLRAHQDLRLGCQPKMARVRYTVSTTGQDSTFCPPSAINSLLFLLMPAEIKINNNNERRKINIVIIFLICFSCKKIWISFKQEEFKW